MIVLFTLTTTIDNIDTNYNISLANNTHYHTQPPPVYTFTMIISTTTLQPLQKCRGGSHTVILHYTTIYTCCPFQFTSTSFNSNEV